MTQFNSFCIEPILRDAGQFLLSMGEEFSEPTIVSRPVYHHLLIAFPERYLTHRVNSDLSCFASRISIMS